MRMCNPKNLLATLIVSIATINIGLSQNLESAKLDTLSIGLDRFMSADQFEPIAKFLRKELKMPVKYENFSSLVELSGSHQKYDFLYSNAFGFAYTQVLDLPYEAFLARANAEGKALAYNSCIITKADSELTDIAQVLDEAAELNLSFTYASSTSGHIAPRIFLTSQLGASLENEFKEVEFQSSHEDVINKVAEGSIDVGACSCFTLEVEMADNEALANNYKILWRSEDIPHAVWVTGPRLDANMKNKLTKAFAKIKKYPAAWELVNITEMTQYVPVESSSFDYFTDELKKDEELEFYLYYYESFSK